ncbi:hypothetical protein [Leptolyngbya sp. NIES-2104]|uniref:hypothetical protein n=1 Tax=Leptolyngbya sp. NIES-2104 TaxID=1552121 RepID=UPI0006EC549D|nr:hypothetical protein [Leptolyngbya sp. NIES-2104]GAP94148.1 hypothetical protein NIES2104_06580 [Leptolyngbya sp. NIES-2104]
MPTQEKVRLSMQVTFSSIILCFCLFKLSNPNDSQSSALYWGGVTSVLAWWMPSPGGSSTSRDSTSVRADEVNVAQIEKIESVPPIESIPQMNGSQN